MKISSYLTILIFLLSPLSKLISQRDSLLTNVKINIPTNLKESFIYLDSLFSDSTKLQIKNMQKSEFIGNTHFGLGRWMRNNWGLWKGSSDLHKYFISKGIWHADDMSGIILTTYYRRLTGKNIKLSHQFRESKKYWRQMKDNEKSPKITAFTDSRTKYQDLKSALTNADSITSITLDKIEIIPKKLKRFKNLQELEIENSPNLKLDEAVNILAKLDSLRELSFWDNSRKIYPPQLGNLANIETIWISGDSITELPSFIPNLNRLNDLFIGNCPKVNFHDLIEELVSLENLEELDLSDNKLKAIPENINKLQQLKKLYLSENEITEISDEV